MFRLSKLIFLRKRGRSLLCRPLHPFPAELDADAEGPQRWTAKHKAALVIDILQGKTTSAKAARQHALTLAEIEQ